MVSQRVRAEAKSQSASFTRGSEFAPYVFKVKLSAKEYRGLPLDEFRLMLRSLNLATPRELLTLYDISTPLSSIHAPSALNGMIGLLRKYDPQLLNDYVIFFICGAVALNNKPIYHTFSQYPETGKPAGDLFINIYGGAWWGRYVFVDLCAFSRFRDYPSILDLDSPADRLTLLTTYVDELIDMQFVKSTIYLPRYNIQMLVDIIVVDASGAGITFQKLVEAFDIELAEQALKTLTPYNLFTFRQQLYSLNDIPGFANSITVKNDTAIVNPYQAYQALKSSNIIGRSEEGIVYIPAVIVVTPYNTYVEEEGTTGIAIKDPEDPRYPLAAFGASSYVRLFITGLTKTVVHEIAHAIGLRHPHDDFNEQKNSDIYSRIYTYSIETYMSYSDSWTEAAKRRTMREGQYPIRTFWSIFDLDTIDRAMISLLLEAYEKNYGDILRRLGEVGLSLDDTPTVKNALGRSKTLALRAVDEFKRINYFDRFEFKGLAADLKTSFDYAFMAMALTELSKTYVEGVVQQNARLMPELQNLEREISQLTSTLDQLRAEKEDVTSELNTLKQDYETALATKNRLESRLNELKGAVEEADALSKQKAELESKVGQEQQTLSSVLREVDSARNLSILLTAAVVAVVMAGGLVTFVVLRRR
jgi:uncharacterized protein YoxC